MFWQNNVLLLFFLSLFGEPILTTACFYLYIASVLNIYCIYQRRMCFWKHKRKILFIVTRLELSVFFMEELSLAEFSGSHSQCASKWQRTVRMKLFLKLCGIQENLVPFKNANLYGTFSCCFDKNIIDGPTIEKIYEKCACFLFSTTNFITQVKGKRRANKKLNSATSGIDTFFLKRMPKTFGATNTLNFSNLSFPKLTFPTYA